MRIKFGKIVFDPQEGFGSVPNQLEIEYRGFAVIMRPDTFNRLVPPLLPVSDVQFVDYVSSMGEKMRQGTPVAPPFLAVDFQTKSAPKILGHEGRHRVAAIQAISKDNPSQMVLVHVFPANGMRARHLTADMISQFRDHAIPQKKTRPINGPLFDKKVWFNSQWLDLEHDLEAPRHHEAGTPVLAKVQNRIAVFKRKCNLQ